MYVRISRLLFTHKIRFNGYYLGRTICRLWIETVFRWKADGNRLGRRDVSKTDKSPNRSVTERKDLKIHFSFHPVILLSILLIFPYCRTYRGHVHSIVDSRYQQTADKRFSKRTITENNVYVINDLWCA